MAYGSNYGEVVGPAKQTTREGVPEYLPRHAHVGSSGFTNYTGAKPKPADVWADFPEAVIVDGSDDFGSPKQHRPTVLATKYGVNPLALFHTGISGITRSGVVLDRAGWEKFAAAYEAEFGYEPQFHLRVFFPKGN